MKNILLFYRKVANYFSELIVEYNRNVMRLIDSKYPHDLYQYYKYPLRFDSFSILTITIVHRFPPTDNATSTTAGPTRPTGTPGPTDRTPSPSTQPPQSTTTRAPSTTTTTVQTSTPAPATTTRPTGGGS